MDLKVDGKSPGDEIALASSGTVTVAAAVASNVPLDRVELMVNGQPAYSVSAAGKDAIEFTRRIAIDRSSWIALRALGPRHRMVLNDTAAFAHSSPVYVTVGGRAVRVAEDVRFYRDWVERLIARTETRDRFDGPERKAEVLALFRKALAWYQAAEASRPAVTGAQR